MKQGHHRTLQAHLQSAARQLPVVVLTGPRQSGKTTLCRMCWPHKAYVNLERPDHRAFATEDPRAFLAAHPDGALLDEIQRVPELTSWLQALVDEDPRPGRWILTGSEQLALTDRTSQSLAGRAAVARLLPFDVEELSNARALARSTAGPSWPEATLRGGYPAPLSRPVSLDLWLSSYVQTYVERDVRALLSVSDLGRFQDFLALAAAWTSQVVNLSRLGADVGVTHPTARSWLGVLEATFVLHRLRPWHRNLGKRLSKTPKLYFWDTGLLCWLLRLREDAQLVQHPLRGPVFETWVVSELLKLCHHRGEVPEAFFYRDQSGLEVDLLLRRPDHWLVVEVKSGTTVASDWVSALRRFGERAGGALDGLPLRPVLVYGGEEATRRGEVRVVPWHDVASLVR